MPYVINWPHKRVIALAAASLSFLVAASPAAAFGGWNSPYSQYQPSAPSSSSCQIPSGTNVFSAFGDNASYALMPGGDFSSPLTGWALNGASVVPGGEPWNLSGDSVQHSLSLPPGGYAVTPTYCVTSALPTWRFFAQAPDSGLTAQLKVTALYTDMYGNSGQMTTTMLNGSDYATWQPTPVLAAGSLVPSGDVVNVRLVFSATSNGGAWNVDDLFVDPYAR